MKRKWIIALIMLGAVSAIIWYGFVSFKADVLTSDIKRMAEQKVGQIVGATVKIGGIKVGLLKYISLNGLRVDREQSKRFFYLVDIKKIVFRYNLFNFFKTRILAPNKIYLYTPTIEFSKIIVPQQFFALPFTGKHSPVLLEVRDGSVVYVLPGLKTRFSFDKIDGEIVPQKEGTFSLNFHGKGSDDISGDISVEGVVERDGKCSLVVHFKNVTIASPEFVPLSDMQGVLTITNDTIGIDEIKAVMRGIPVTIHGTVTSYSSAPVLDMTVRSETPSVTSSLRLFGTPNDARTEGTFAMGRYAYALTGAIVLKEGGFELRDGRINGEYDASGDFRFNDGTYSLRFKKKGQEVVCDFQHTDYTMQLALSLNHISFLGYDFVTVGTVTLEPDIAFWRDKRLVLNGAIKTDYMIFNYMPLTDFRGTFTIAPDGLKNVQCRWGDVYSARGSIGFEEPYPVKGDLTITNFDLEQCDSFGGIVLPDTIAGTIDGHIEVDGPAASPQIEGYIHSGPGHFKAFDFSKATINFSGSPSVLTLHDSKMYRGNSVFNLRGIVDFTKENIFHDLLLESSEKIILWRGWDLSKNVEEDTFLLKRKMSDAVDLNVKGTVRSSDTEGAPANEGTLSLDYRYRDDQRISLSYEEGQDDQTVSLKHTLTF